MIATHWIVDIMSAIFLMTTQEFGGTVKITISLKLAIYQKGFILEKVIEKQEEKKVIPGSKDVLFFLYIRKSHLTKYSSIIFNN